MSAFFAANFILVSVNIGAPLHANVEDSKHSQIDKTPSLSTVQSGEQRAGTDKSPHVCSARNNEDRAGLAHPAIRNRAGALLA